MVGNVPDYDAMLAQYATLAEHKAQAPTAPALPQSVRAGALGSRGLCSAPLTAEVLAAQMSHEPPPLDRDAGGVESESIMGAETAEGKAVK